MCLAHLRQKAFQPGAQREGGTQGQKSAEELISERVLSDNRTDHKPNQSRYRSRCITLTSPDEMSEPGQRKRPSALNAFYQHRPIVAVETQGKRSVGIKKKPCA